MVISNVPAALWELKGHYVVFGEEIKTFYHACKVLMHVHGRKVVFSQFKWFGR